MSPVLLCVAALSAPEGDASARSGDFAYGLTLAPIDERPINTVLMPEEVYKATTRTDLGDLRVFNGAGEQVPHGIRSLARATSERSPTVVVPFFPVHGEAEQPLDGLALQIDRREDGTLVKLTTETAPAAAGPLRAYVVDLTSVKEPIESLTLSWTTTRDSFVANLDVDSGEDLRYWGSVTSQAVARLAYQGHELERRQIDMVAVRRNYLRFTWSGELPFTLTEVLVKPVSRFGEPDRQQSEVHGEAAGAPGAYSFDTRGPFPIDRVQVLLPEANTLVRADLKSSAAAEGPWTTRHSGLLYRTSIDGQELASPELRVGRSTDRYWRLEVGQKGGGIGGGVPSLRVGWLPQQLMFVARGEGPFLLAYGSARVSPSSFDPTSLINMVPGSKADALEQTSVRVSQPKTLAGAEALRAPPRSNTKKWILWGVLILGVLILGAMSLRLMRQLEEPVEQEDAEDHSSDS